MHLPAGSGTPPAHPCISVPPLGGHSRARAHACARAPHTIHPCICTTLAEGTSPPCGDVPTPVISASLRHRHGHPPRCPRHNWASHRKAPTRRDPFGTSRRPSTRSRDVAWEGVAWEGGWTDGSDARDAPRRRATLSHLPLTMVAGTTAGARAWQPLLITQHHTSSADRVRHPSDVRVLSGNSRHRTPYAHLGGTRSGGCSLAAGQWPRFVIRQARS